MFTRKILTGVLSIGLLLTVSAPVAQAYLNPYDVIHGDLLLPSSTRESLSRVERQQRESAARRDREFQVVYDEQHPEIPEEPLFAAAGEEQVFGSAPAAFPVSGDAVVDREFVTLMRTLERVQKNRNEQALRAQALSLLAQEGLHAGAPLNQLGFLPTGSQGLAPTGAGTFLAVGLVLAAVWWTVRRSKRDDVVVGV